MVNGVSSISRRTHHVVQFNPEIEAKLFKGGLGWGKESTVDLHSIKRGLLTVCFPQRFVEQVPFDADSWHGTGW